MRAHGMAAGGFLLGCILSGCGGGGRSFAPPAAVVPSPLTITSASPLPRAVTGQAYSTKLQASGGTLPYTWSTLQPGFAGLSLATDGTISGTPTASMAGDYMPTFQVTDARGVQSSAALELLVVAPLAFFGGGGALPDGNVGLTYYGYLPVQGGVQPYTYSLASGSNPLPAGLALNSANQWLTGMPTALGSYSFTVQVTDSGSP